MKDSHLPCAGITLIRFYGYNLSLTFNWLGVRPARFWAKHPGNFGLIRRIWTAVSNRGKGKGYFFLARPCNFQVPLIVLLQNQRMKKIFLSLLLLAAATGAVTAQKVINDANAEKRNVTGFHGVDVGGGIDLYITQGNEEAVAVSASDVKYRDRIRTEVKNGVLKIWYDYNGKFRLEPGPRRMKAYVSCKELDILVGSGGSDVWVEGSIKTGKLDMEISGGSDFHGKIEAKTLKVNASGGSDVNISGSASNLTLEASGGSDFKGYDLSTDTCDIEASGGSDVYITVNKEMTADASGGSDIRYKGAGLIREIKSSGSSDIKRVSK